jgi:hypothetical protein
VAVDHATLLPSPVDPDPLLDVAVPAVDDDEPDADPASVPFELLDDSEPVDSDPFDELPASFDVVDSVGLELAAVEAFALPLRLSVL